MNAVAPSAPAQSQHDHDHRELGSSGVREAGLQRPGPANSRLPYTSRSVTSRLGSVAAAAPARDAGDRCERAAPRSSRRLPVELEEQREHHADADRGRDGKQQRRRERRQQPGLRQQPAAGTVSIRPIRGELTAAKINTAASVEIGIFPTSRRHSPLSQLDGSASLRPPPPLRAPAAPRAVSRNSSPGFPGRRTSIRSPLPLP